MEQQEALLGMFSFFKSKRDWWPPCGVLNCQLGGHGVRVRQFEPLTEEVRLPGGRTDVPAESPPIGPIDSDGALGGVNATPQLSPQLSLDFPQRLGI